VVQNVGRKGILPRPRSLPLLCACLLGAILGHASVASSTELIPSVGLTRSVDSDKVKLLYGVALRSYVIPRILKGEIAGQYCRQTLYGGDLKLRIWPVTASLYVAPISMLYAGAGVGWYHTTYDYDESLGFEDETRQEFGVHVGGGMQVPIVPSAALDLNGRYVFLQDQESKLIPDEFNPDFWSLTLGLAISF
jgi:hypothetical protein